MMDTVLHAETAGLSFARDRELALPDRPRFIPELIVGPFDEEGVLIAGAGAPDVISGRSARHVLSRVIPLLDGTRGTAEIAAALPDLPSEVVLDNISLLCSRGFLEDGGGGPAPCDPQLAAYLGRYNDATRCNRNRAGAADRIAATSLAFHGPAPSVAQLSAMLDGAGFRIARDGRAGLPLRISHGAAEDGGGGGGVPIRLGAGAAVIGPLIAPGRTLCPACLERQHPHPAGAPDPLFETLALGLAAQLVLTTICLTFAANLHRGAFRYRRDAAGGLTGEMVQAPRLPGCPDCGIGGTWLEPGDPRAAPWQYHSATAIAARGEISRRDHQNHYQPGNLALARARPAILPGRNCLPLPRPALTRMPRGQPAAAPTLGQLAALLQFAGGERVADDGMPRRLPPSGGNLRSPRIWVCARGVEGLARGLYLYEPAEHGLRRFGGFDDVLLAAGLRARSGLPPCVLIAAGDLTRVRRKYRDFALRVVHLDAGIALHYTALAARYLGLDLAEYPDFDLGVLEPFGVPFRPEHPLAVTALGLGVPDRASPPPAARPAPRRSAGWLADGPVERTIAAMTQARMTAAARSAAADGPAETTGPDTDPQVRAAYLRRSVRAFSGTPATPSALTQVLSAGSAALRARAAAGGPPLHLALYLAQQVAQPGLAAGFYLAAPGAAPTRLAGFDASAARECFLQRGLAEAPSALVAVADLDAAMQSFGARGYAVQLTGAGLALGAAWLAATSLGLAGCVAAGLLPQGFRDAAGLDGYTACPLLALHLGHEPAPGPE